MEKLIETIIVLYIILSVIVFTTMMAANHYVTRDILIVDSRLIIIDNSSYRCSIVKTLKEE